MNKLKEFKGKIITVIRKYDDNGILKYIGYVDNNLHTNYVCGLYVDNSMCCISGISSDLERDINREENICSIRETNEYELKTYIKECEKFFNSVLKEKGRPPFARFPLPIIDKFYMDDFWRDVLMKEQQK